VLRAIRTCRRCGVPLAVTVRANAATCSTACRSAIWRARDRDRRRAAAELIQRQAAAIQEGADRATLDGIADEVRRILG